jgi:hypothetical protein
MAQFSNLLPMQNDLQDRQDQQKMRLASPTSDHDNDDRSYGYDILDGAEEVRPPEINHTKKHVVSTSKKAEAMRSTLSQQPIEIKWKHEIGVIGKRDEFPDLAVEAIEQKSSNHSNPSDNSGLTSHLKSFKSTDKKKSDLGKAAQPPNVVKGSKKKSIDFYEMQFKNDKKFIEKQVQKFQEI